MQNDDECTGEESSEYVDDNVTKAALDLVLPDVVDDAIIDELNENDVSSNSIFNHISLTLDCIYSLHVFLHENSKLQSLSDKQLVDILQNSDVLYTNATLAYLKSIIRGLRTIYHDNQHVQCLKLSGRKYDIVSQISTILGGSELSLIRKERQSTKQPSSLHTICLKALKRKKKLNVMAAHHIMNAMYKTWKSESPMSFEIADLPQDLWCSVPELHAESNALLLHFIDYCHLNIRIRMCLIKDKLQFVKINGWMFISKLSESPLPISVLNGAVPQSKSFAELMFSLPVQTLL